MIELKSITRWFADHGQLRKSQRKTLAALVWALLQDPLSGVAVMGRSLARAKTTSIKHAVKRVDRFLGNGRIDLEVACGDLIAQVVGMAAEVFLTLDWTDLKTPDHAYQTLNGHVRAHRRAIPIAWTTVRKTDRTDQMRAHEIALCQRVARIPSRLRHLEHPRTLGPALAGVRVGVLLAERPPAGERTPPKSGPTPYGGSGSGAFRNTSCTGARCAGPLRGLSRPFRASAKCPSLRTSPPATGSPIRERWTSGAHCQRQV